MLQPSDIDRVTDQDPELLQSVERCSGAISVGLKNAGYDALAREPGDSAMTVFGAEHLKTANVACLARIAEADIFGALHVGGNERSNSTWRRRSKPISNRCGLAKQCGLVGRQKFFGKRMRGPLPRRKDRYVWPLT